MTGNGDERNRVLGFPVDLAAIQAGAKSST
jgi:hypothetical protein